MVKSLRVWISTVLVVTGLLWLLDAIGLLSAGPVIGRRWPLAIVALGGLAVAAGRRLAPGAVALILIGAGMLISRLASTTWVGSFGRRLRLSPGGGC